MKNAEMSIGRNIEIEPIKFVVEEKGKQFKIDGCKVITEFGTVYFNYEAYIATFFVELVADLPDYRHYSDKEIVNMMKEQAQKDCYKWYSSDKIIKEEEKTTWWKFELENKHNFNVKKKLVEEGYSKIFNEWSKYSERRFYKSVGVGMQRSIDRGRQGHKRDRLNSDKHCQAHSCVQ